MKFGQITADTIVVDADSLRRAVEAFECEFGMTPLEYLLANK